jgi:hypothetical protein
MRILLCGVSGISRENTSELLCQKNTLPAQAEHVLIVDSTGSIDFRFVARFYLVRTVLHARCRCCKVPGTSTRYQVPGTWYLSKIP